ncbi:hypothetical protein BW721_07195 [Jeotgalibaca sp. PTS2502]|uniref:BREX system P-loop protein BrxC n=1 Tax=Jeotgalibaca sp. PTS2502 TaxID=1903686 RepID=UPI0009735A08|nr:BREX system P-loop protein BrxC [Jeotgalibaca sp. PTS2502]APZ49477.1 hypothetical protein BW721_07195 [Jeotgalibaca sp. PTS2502]
MQIERLFKKDINREIQGVVKIGPADAEQIQNELEEYVVTSELQKHFKSFFKAYHHALETETDRVGVWISGFFGSGKSHFLKILSYLLNSNLEVNGQKAADFFADKLDKETFDLITEVAQVPSDVILFNIDSKADVGSKQNKLTLVQVFNKVFNEMRGYSASIPWLAQLEETLDKNNQYDAFKAYFEEETGLSWIEGRDEIFFNMDEAIVALSKATSMTEESARSWIENGEDNYSISVDSFSNRLKSFIDQKPDNYQLVFAVDEVGQFVSDNLSSMLNLQTIVEDLGKQLKGRVWVIVTAQQEIKGLADAMSELDYSKIQGRFNTRLSLSSANADEVIKIRLLDKTEAAEDTLVLTYDQQEAALKNKLEFEETATMKFYQDRQEFAAVYPFIPYQFNLLQKVFTSIREHGSSRKHFSDGERNLLESVQQATRFLQNETIGQLVPFSLFYESIDGALEHSVRSTILKAEQNDSLTDFDISVLKLLFLIRYVDEMPGTIKNLTTLLINQIDEDTLELGKKVSDSLLRLQKEFLIQRIGNEYFFLTNEEQDVNREIERVQLPTSELVLEAGRMIYDDILSMKRFIYQPFPERKDIQYLFDFSQWIDDRAIRNGHIDMGLKVLSLYSGYTEDTEVRAVSAREEKVILQLPEEEQFDELRQYLKINRYLREQTSKSKSPVVEEIHLRKANERNQLQSLIKLKLQTALEHAIIYINGYDLEANGTSQKRIETGLHALIGSLYHKINYMKHSFTKDEVEELIQTQELDLLDLKYSDENQLATKEIKDYLLMKNDLNVSISVRELMERFGSAPYGWKELDIIASLIGLIKEEDIQASLNSRRFNLNESDFLKTFMKKDIQEKMILSIRVKVSEDLIQSAERIMSDIFGMNHIRAKEEDMHKEIVERFSREQRDLNYIHSQYQYNSFPDEQLVKEVLQKVDRLVSITDSHEFFRELARMENELMDDFDELAQVKEFFDTPKMKEHYRNAQEKRKLYDQDKNYLNNPEIDHIMTTIQDILKMARPYHRIKELPDLIERFNYEVDSHLQGISQPILDALNQDKQDIVKEIDDWLEFAQIKRIQESFRFKMEDLEKKILHANLVSRLLSYKGESNEIKVTTLRQIETTKREIYDEQERRRKRAEAARQKVEDVVREKDKPMVETPEGPQIPAVKEKPKKVMVISKETILPSQLVEIQSEADIENYLGTLRAELQRLLSSENVDALKLS